jgi:cardiolipin-specific phospholipase
LHRQSQWAGRHGTAVYALDWLGTGRSARVPFTVKAKRDDIPGRVHEAESFFVQSLEEWRELMGLEKMTLIGHSLGAYLIVVYALRYPTRVSKLILLSPAGVSHCPVATVPWRGLTDIEDDDKSDEYATSVTKAEPDDMKKGLKKVPALVRRLRMKLFAYLWEEGWSPFQVVRTAMFWGPLLIGKVCSSIKYNVATANTHSSSFRDNQSQA